MKIKKPLCLLLAFMIAATVLSACAGKKTDETSLDKYIALQANENGTVTIPVQEITAEAKYFNFDANGVTVQIVALRDKDGGVHLAFNTCQSCSPSPKAYYQQNGDVLQCENCGFTFAPEEVGITHGGCNPWPISGMEIDDSVVTIPVLSIESMRAVFTTWEGPTK